MKRAIPKTDFFSTYSVWFPLGKKVFYPGSLSKKNERDWFSHIIQFLTINATTIEVKIFYWRQTSEFFNKVCSIGPIFLIRDKTWKYVKKWLFIKSYNFVCNRTCFHCYNSCTTKAFRVIFRPTFLLLVSHVYEIEENLFERQFR